jgi:ABC-type lipoprotein release transport system permease subunit
LFEVQPDDPLTMVTTAIFMFALAGLAGFLPAWRAALLDPTAALRCE